MNSGVFITGTDTGIGKTEISSAIARMMRARGRKVGVMKPVASGCGLKGGKLVSVDTLRLMAAAQTDDDPSLVTPQAYRAPLPPAVAAREEHAPFDMGKVMAAWDTLRQRHEFMVVEGVGGLLVPLDDTTLVADLIRRLDLPVVVVSRSGLGTINHTLLTVREARRQGLTVIGIVLNHASSAEPDPSAATNAAVIRHYADAPVLAEVPFLHDLLEIEKHLAAGPLADMLLGPGPS
jgi:dethiobiotin synthetase